MKILIIDRDESTANLVKTRLELAGHQPTVSTAKADAIEGLSTKPVDLVFLDPSPLTNARQLVISIRRKLPTYTYIVLMGPDITPRDAFAAGANGALVKPFSPQQIVDHTGNADRLLNIMRRLNNPDEDFPSGGGVIAKSAFAQLFLSAIDRADRYTEQSFIIFMSLRNFNQIKVHDTDNAAQMVSATLARQLSRIRRQSDILAQTGPHEYALLLQRPNYPTEPVDAALRFADTLAKNTDLYAATKIPVELSIELLEVPSGRLLAGHDVTVTEKAA